MKDIRWSGGSGGHVVAYEVKNGKPILMDAQTGTNYNFVKIAVE